MLQPLVEQAAQTVELRLKADMPKTAIVRLGENLLRV